MGFWPVMPSLFVSVRRLELPWYEELGSHNGRSQGSVARLVDLTLFCAMVKYEDGRILDVVDAVLHSVMPGKFLS
jgi:hypothetical protein